MDAVPLLSQTKSLVQWICQDPDGALLTQENFSKRCPLISQLRSAGEAILGHPEDAKKTQLEFVNEMEFLVNGMPIIGHVKGGVHYICKDNEKGDDAMKAASRTVGVLLGGIGGGVVGGPVGAVSGGIAGGVALDGITTSVESAVKREVCPNGVLRICQELRRNPSNPGLYVDTMGGLMLDGLSGYASFRFTARVVAAAEGSSLVSKLPNRLRVTPPAGAVSSQIVKSNSTNRFVRLIRGTTSTLANLRVPAEMFIARVVSTYTQTSSNGCTDDDRNQNRPRSNPNQREIFPLEDMSDPTSRPTVMVKPNPVIGLLEKEFGRVVPFVVDRFCEYYAVEDGQDGGAGRSNVDPKGRAIVTLPASQSTEGGWISAASIRSEAEPQKVEIGTQTEISPDAVLILSDDDDWLSNDDSARLSDDSWVLVADADAGVGTNGVEVIVAGDCVEEINECPPSPGRETSCSSSVLSGSSPCQSLEDYDGSEDADDDYDENGKGFRFTSKPKLVLRLRN